MLFALVSINQLSSTFTRNDGIVFDGTPGVFPLFVFKNIRVWSLTLCGRDSHVLAQPFELSNKSSVS